ncbi:MAG: BAX inhibitor (BI)-1/YccA family protein [Proteobacteria bacterium]|nr:BAX inhibitor (BI)-1/YccA family protein [Pseudomonadota bacterium]
MRGSPAPFGGRSAADGGLAAYMRTVYGYMTAGLGLTGVIAAWLMGNPETLAAFTGSIWFWVALIGELGLVVVLSLTITRMSGMAAFAMFMVYSALNGLTIAPLTYMYTTESVAGVFFVTAGMFASLSFYGFVTKRDLSAMGKFLFMALIGLIIVMVVNIFVASSMLGLLISAAAVLIFAGLTVYDTQKIKELYSDVAGDSENTHRAAVLGALTLYLDFINMFLHLLRLFGQRK